MWVDQSVLSPGINVGAVVALMLVSLVGGCSAGRLWRNASHLEGEQDPDDVGFALVIGLALASSLALAVTVMPGSLGSAFQSDAWLERWISEAAETLETLLFTQDLDANILDTFRQFQALRG